MSGSCLNFDNPIRDAISRIRFAPISNNLLISSWDSSLRLYDVDKCELRFEAHNEGPALLDCCFESESVALTANSDGSILRYDMRVGNSKVIGNHEDLATCIEYSEETRQVISASWDKRVKFWDPRSTSSLGCLSSLGMEVDSMSLSGLNLMVAHQSSVHLYDLRYLDGLVQAKEYFMDVKINCVCSNSELEGFIVGSADGRVALRHVGQSDTNEGYAFRCYPKDGNGRLHIVAVNDIAFNPSARGVVVTGDDEGYALIWDVLKRKRFLDIPIVLHLWHITMRASFWLLHQVILTRRPMKEKSCLRYLYITLMLNTSDQSLPVVQGGNDSGEHEGNLRPPLFLETNSFVPKQIQLHLYKYVHTQHLPDSFYIPYEFSQFYSH